MSEPSQPSPGQPPAGTPDYAVVIPAFNEAEFLPRTLAGLAAAMAEIREFRGEVVVTDNNSSDATGDIARAAGARVVFEPVNQISRARNAGAAATRARFLIFLDADTEAGPELLRPALNALAGGRICGGGARVGTTDKLTNHWADRALGLWNFLARTLGLAAGSFVYCLRLAWEETGGFSHQVYAGEELFFSKALKRWGRRRGLRFVVLREAVDTSMRKLEWFRPWTIAWVFLRFFCMPWMLRSRKHCHIWYERPPAKPQGSDEAA